MNDAPADEPRYAVDVTPADVTAALLFIAPRLEAELGDGYLAGTARFRMAVALGRLAAWAGRCASSRLEELAEDNFVGARDRRRCERDLFNAWNVIAQTVLPWHREPGYDTARWQLLDYIDAQDEAERQTEESADE